MVGHLTTFENKKSIHTIERDREKFKIVWCTCSYTKNARTQRSAESGIVAQNERRAHGWRRRQRQRPTKQLLPPFRKKRINPLHTYFVGWSSYSWTEVVLRNLLYTAYISWFAWCGMNHTLTPTVRYMAWKEHANGIEKWEKVSLHILALFRLPQRSEAAAFLTHSLVLYADGDVLVEMDG